jgi:hypothetical protein
VTLDFKVARVGSDNAVLLFEEGVQLFGQGGGPILHLGGHMVGGEWRELRGCLKIERIRLVDN